MVVMVIGGDKSLYLMIMSIIGNHLINAIIGHFMGVELLGAVATK
jgi:hypothetical protein